MSFENISNFLNTVTSVATTIGSSVNSAHNLINNVQNFASDPVAYVTGNRLRNFPIGAETYTPNYTTASWGIGTESTGNDWRVRLHVPAGAPGFSYSPILDPLRESGNSMVFPVTPQVMVTHSASYNSMSPVHTNYAYQMYQNSQVEDITITCDFPVENEADGRYWIAAVHFLRSVTKMYYGESSSRGAPPPLVHLSGYGDFMFNRVPVVVKMFTIDLRDSVDYIQVPIGPGVSLGPEFERAIVPGGYAYVPTLSMISVTLSPSYSRDQTRQFSLETFIQGGYIGDGGGFI